MNSKINLSNLFHPGAHPLATTAAEQELCAAGSPAARQVPCRRQLDLRCAQGCIAVSRIFSPFNTLQKGKTMKAKFATSCFIIGALLAPVAAHAADSDSDSDRTQPMTFVKDSAITTKVKAKLASEKLSTLAHIRVDTDRNGAVVLSGKVKSQKEADKAVSIASNTEGVTSVASNLQITKDD